MLGRPLWIMRTPCTTIQVRIIRQETTSSAPINTTISSHFHRYPGNEMNTDRLLPLNHRGSILSQNAAAVERLHGPLEEPPTVRRKEVVGCDSMRMFQERHTQQAKHIQSFIPKMSEVDLSFRGIHGGAYWRAHQMAGRSSQRITISLLLNRFPKPTAETGTHPKSQIQNH